MSNLLWQYQASAHFLTPAHLCTPTLRKRTYLSPVIVIVKPSYSFPWSLRLGTLVFTVNPSFVLVLNCFQGKRKFTLLVRFIVNSQSAAPTLTLMFLRRLRECKSLCPLSWQLVSRTPTTPSTLSAQVTLPILAASVQDAYASIHSQPKSHSPWPQRPEENLRAKGTQLSSMATLTPKSSIWVFSLVHLNWQKL